MFGNVGVRGFSWSPGWVRPIIAGTLVSLAGATIGCAGGSASEAGSKESALVSAALLSKFATSWQEESPGGALATARHECGFVEHDGQGYLLGGRGDRPTEILSSAGDLWASAAAPPEELHHFQPVSLGSKIFVLGAMQGSFPNETSVPTIYSYTPGSDVWAVEGVIPAARQRASAGVVEHEGWIYVAGGLTNGHVGGAVAWFDRYNPVTGAWEVLPDAPRARDHFQAAVVDDQILLVAGRVTSEQNAVGATVGEVDVFNIQSQTWETLAGAPIPTERAGAATSVVGSFVIVSGGESDRPAAHVEVEGLYVPTSEWVTFPSLNQARHGHGAVVLGDRLFAAAGNGAQGGGAELNTLESWGVNEEESPVEPAFFSSVLEGTILSNPTSLMFGPDERLYVSEQYGVVRAYEIERTSVNTYEVLSAETIFDINQIANHSDTGELVTEENTRQVTGLLASGTASTPVLYVTSSDPRIGAGGGGEDLNLDTNSGIISRLTWNGGSWDHVALVRGLPRSEENHAPNGLILDDSGQLLLAVGGFTNAGAPSNNFAFIGEYALSAAILQVDLPAIEALPTLTDASGALYKLDLPTLDDPTRPNENLIDDPSAPGYDGVDVGDPFGGNDGLNQAVLRAGGLVQIYASGFRNAYDLVKAADGRIYVIDNSANQGWGGHPLGEGAYPGSSAGMCTNDYLASEPGSTGPGPNDGVVNHQNGLHWVRPLVPGDKNYPGQDERYYGGHPTPIRGNPTGAGLWYKGSFLAPGSSQLPVDWPPVDPSQAEAAECDFRNSGVTDNAIANFGASANGLTEYTASNFGGTLAGTLLLAAFNGDIYQVRPSAGEGTQNCPAPPASCSDTLASGLSSVPLDIFAQGDAGPFAGTIWIANYGSNSITVLEPVDYDGASSNPGDCQSVAQTHPAGDEDLDGYTNGDEVQNGTNPCSGASRPADRDADLVSDLLDLDDDNDSILDVDDPFAIDATNGTLVSLPVDYEFFNAHPGTGFFGLGFTGLMTSGTRDYLQQFSPEDVIAGGTSGLLTLAAVSEGDAIGSVNSQDFGFQYGIDPTSAAGPFTVYSQINGPFFGGAPPELYQSQGVFLGTGDQENYVKLVLSYNSGFEVAVEIDGVFEGTRFDVPGATAEQVIGLYLMVDPVAGSVQPAYLFEGQELQNLGPVVPLSRDLLEAALGNHSVSGVPVGLALGITSTSAGVADPFVATWDFLKAAVGYPLSDGSFPSDTPATCSDQILNGDEEQVDCGGACPPCPTCSDGQMNGQEAGVDCGGSCPVACPTCSDGVLNGNEEQVDCGGSCAPCETSCADLASYDTQDMESSSGEPVSDGWILLSNGALSLLHNFEPGPKSIVVTARGQEAGGGWPNMVLNIDGAPVGNVTVDSLSLRQYEFNFVATGVEQVINIEFDNDYYVEPEDRNLIVAQMLVTCAEPTAPSCTDGIENGDEAGVDCGGSCPSACPSCTDGMVNGDELGVDCGGSCAPCDPTCSDLANYAATAMSASTGGEVSDGWNIWSNGTLSVEHSFSPGPKTLTIVARGEEAGGGWPHLLVHVDGVTVGDVVVDSSSLSQYAFTFEATGSEQSVSIEFDNDYYVEPEDRNLIVAQLLISCAEATGPSCSDGVQNGEETGLDCGGSCAPCEPSCSGVVSYDALELDASTGGSVSDGWNIWSDGSLSIEHDFEAGPLSIVVTARGEEAGGEWPNMMVRVGGVSIGNTSVNSSALEQYAFDYVASSGVQTVSVEFDNDFYDPPEDRNLIVAELALVCE